MPTNKRISGLTAGTPTSTAIFPFTQNPSGAGTTLKTTFPAAVVALGLMNYAAKGDLQAGTAANGGTVVSVGVNGQKLVPDSSQATGLKWIPDNFGFTYTFGDGSGVLLAGTFTPIEMGVAGSIDSIRLFAGTILTSIATVDVYKFTYAQMGTIVYGTAYSIFGTAAKPSLAGTNRFEGTSYSGTQYAFNKGDWLLPVLQNVGTTIKELSVAFGCRKTAVS